MVQAPAGPRYRAVGYKVQVELARAGRSGALVRQPATRRKVPTVDALASPVEQGLPLQDGKMVEEGAAAHRDGTQELAEVHARMQAHVLEDLAPRLELQHLLPLEA